MIISDGFRLFLYICMSVLPIWSEFFIKSTDYSLRGLAMPIISSLLAAVTVTLAKTSSKRDQQQLPKTASGSIATEVINQPGSPVPTAPQPPTP